MRSILWLGWFVLPLVSANPNEGSLFKERANLTCYSCKSSYVGDQCWGVSHLTPRRLFQNPDSYRSVITCYRYINTRTNLVYRGASFERPWDQNPIPVCSAKYFDTDYPYGKCIKCVTPLCNVGPYDDPEGRCANYTSKAEQQQNEREEKVDFLDNLKNIYKEVKNRVTEFVKKQVKRLLVFVQRAKDCTTEATNSTGKPQP